MTTTSTLKTVPVHGGLSSPVNRIVAAKEAARWASLSRIEAIDMGRRGLHNEGSELLQERLKEKIEVDFDTARRLFTLICVLHWKG